MMMLLTKCYLFLFLEASVDCPLSLYPLLSLNLSYNFMFNCLNFLMARQAPVVQSLLNIEASLSHSDTKHTVGLLWTSDQPDVDTSISQHTTLTTDRHP
jgi:hypothetical protein